MNFFLVVSGVILGPTAVGGLRASQNMVGLINVFFLSMENIVPSKASLLYAKYGAKSMVHYLRNVFFKGVIVVGILVILFVSLDEFLMKFFYGEEYIEFTFLIFWFGLINPVEKCFREGEIPNVFEVFGI